MLPLWDSSDHVQLYCLCLQAPLPLFATLPLPWPGKCAGGVGPPLSRAVPPLGLNRRGVGSQEEDTAKQKNLDPVIYGPRIIKPWT